MKIERLSIDSFGHFHGVELGPFTSRIVVIHGGNGAGKTTLLAFIQAMLFGFPRRTDPLWIPALNGGKPGGRIVLAGDAGERYTVGRSEGVRGGPLTAFDEAGVDLGEDRLNLLLGGISRDTFQNVFAFGIDQLSTIGSLQGNDISSQIYGAGLGARQLPVALAELEKRAGEIFRPGGRTQPVYHLLNDLEEIDRHIRDQPDDAAQYSRLRDDLERFISESVRLREDRRRLQTERARIDSVLDAGHALEHVRGQLAREQANPPDGDEDRLAQRGLAIQEAEQSHARLTVLQRQLQEEERHLAGAGSSSGLPALPVGLLLGALVAAGAGILAGGTMLIVGAAAGLVLAALAAAAFLSRQRRAAGQAAQVKRVRHARAAWQSERASLSNLLAQAGIDTNDDAAPAPALASARAALASVDSVRRAHQQRIEWLRQQIGEREDELADARAALDANDVDLNRRVEDIEAELERIDGQIAAQDQQIGQTRGAIQRLEEGPSTIAGLRARQERLLEELRESAGEWSGQMLAREILLRAQKRFEDEHQPAIVQIARGYLSTITAGQYDRVTVSADKKEIQVFQPNGARKLDRELSRGTREQLYLALRFGYITEFGRKSARLPVIVDDILVNFDPARARATAGAFAELSETNQILVFTCHPATVEHFQAVSPDVQVVELQSVMAIR